MLDTEDIERVHDMRVASRRLRAVLEIFAACFPKAEYSSVLRDVKRLADALGERRDPDVHIAAMEAFAAGQPVANRPGIERLTEDLRSRQARGNDILAAELERVRERDLRGRLIALSDAADAALGDERGRGAAVARCGGRAPTPPTDAAADGVRCRAARRTPLSRWRPPTSPTTPPPDGADGRGSAVKARRVKGLDPAAPLADNAARIVRVRLDELCSFMPRATDPAEVVALHDMRIAAKRLRYVLEVTGPVFGDYAERATRMTKDLQDLLGEIHDCDVQIPEVRAFLEGLEAEDAAALVERAGAADDLDPRLLRHRAAPARLRRPRRAGWCTCAPAGDLLFQPLPRAAGATTSARASARGWNMP